MIRVGDIYEDSTKETVTCTITFVSPHTVNVLGNTGGMFTFSHNPKEEADFLRNRKLIAEYPTWQEAVNSKEFKGEWRMINIQDIIPFMKKGWVAMDSDGFWYWYEKKPKIMNKTKGVWDATSSIWLELDFSAFETIAPADDWTKSLIKVGGK